MDINNNKKIQANGNFDVSTGTKKEYIPALHSEKKDTVELTTKKKQQSQNGLNNVLSGLKKLSNISFGNSNEQKQLTKEEVIAKLDKIDIPYYIKEELEELLVTSEHIKLADKFLSDSRLYENEYLQDSITRVFEFAETPEQAQFVDKFILDPKLYENEDLLYCISEVTSFLETSKQAQIADKFLDTFLSDTKLYENKGLQYKLADIINDSDIQESAQSKIDVMDKFISDSNLYENENLQREIADIVLGTGTKEIAQAKIDVMDKYLSDPKLYENEGLQENIARIIRYTDTQESAQAKIDVIDKFLSDPNLYENENLQREIADIVLGTGTKEIAQAKIYVMDKFISDSDLYENEYLQRKIAYIIKLMDTQETANSVKKMFLDFANGEITQQLLVATLENYGKVSYKQLQKLEKTIGAELFNKICNNKTDVVAAANLIGLYGKNNINEIPLNEKRNVLRDIVKQNIGLFHISDDLKQAFPLIPTNQEEYCSLLPALVKSLGIEVKTLEPTQIEKFNDCITDLSVTLKNIPDSIFDNLTMSHQYSKDTFINDVLDIVKDLSKAERQKVYDYFGFELHHNRKSSTGYSIVGYPVNINNGKKLAQITDEKTKAVVEELRPKVIEFSENNKVSSNIPELDEQLNEILTSLPELHTLFDKPQHGMHEYDVLKHSLKVMKKVVQNPEYEKLNTSDKRIMMLASLLHDITKAENSPDPSHAFESSFDAFYIAKKFNLTKEEQTKLYTLINHHEWLKYVNNQGLSEEKLTKRLQSVAFDLQNDNLFEMSKIFTQADIKAIKKNDGLYDFFGEAFDKYSKQIDEYILELKKTQPLLPTTKLPKASDIEQKITTVNPDCSTNIKGVYKKDELVVIKYNEVKDWEAIGLPKGSISRGIRTRSEADGHTINTGNIKFIVHGLDYSNQLSNFDAFALPDADALLSVSYMERPESKYRLFRQQGVLLDVDSKYIHGGGETDSGSGYGKNITDFKSRYIFGGERQCDRDYISNLIKTTLNLTDEEYIEFVQENQNKSMLEIEPVEVREKLIKQFAQINSNTRRGNRKYNEMYVTNPKVQGCFAYSLLDKVGEVSQFMDEQPDFLKEYAKENNVPFIVFGD